MIDCIFCKIADGSLSSVEKIYENDNFFSIPDKNPIGEGHSLVISKKHFKTFLDMPNSLGPELMDCIKATSLALMKKHDSDGFNIVSNNSESAGQVVPHIHFHLLPRKKDDGKKGINLG